MGLSRDPLRPRAGDWPRLGEQDGPADAVILGVPTWRTSLSPRGARATVDITDQRTVRLAALCAWELLAGPARRREDHPW